MMGMHRFFRRLAPTVWLPVVAGILWVLASGSALAHRVTVFAWVEGDTVYTESRFPDGRAVKGGTVRVLDEDGQILLEGRTGEQGEFSFDRPVQDRLRIVLDAGMGHRAEWVLTAEEENGEPKPTLGRPSKPAGNRSPVQQAEQAPPANEWRASALTAAEVEEIVADVLEEKLAPLQKAFREARDDRISVTEVLGGIGYIFGLIGVAAYFSRRR